MPALESVMQHESMFVVDGFLAKHSRNIGEMVRTKDFFLNEQRVRGKEELLKSLIVGILDG
jgi:hypothetical protein